MGARRAGTNPPMATEPDPLRVSQLVRRAVEICDDSGEDAVLGELARALEDDDVPATAVDDVAEHVTLAAVRGGVDVEDPAVRMAIAAVVYLRHRRSEADGDAADVLRLAARAEWDGAPPEDVADWLAARGVSA